MSDENDTPTTETTAPGDWRSRPRKSRLDKLSHLRRGLANVVRDIQRWNPEDLSPSEKISRARCLGFLYAELGALLKADEIERRLSQVEDLLRGRIN